VECVWNKSDEMLTAVLSDANGLYWEVEVQEQPQPQWKKIKINDKSVMDSISTVKTAISLIKTCQHQAKSQSKVTVSDLSKMIMATDKKTVDSQTSTITQLTEQVSILQLAHNEIDSKLNKLTECIMAQAANPATPSQSKCKQLVASQEAPAKQHDDLMQLAM